MTMTFKKNFHNTLRPKFKVKKSCMLRAIESMGIRDTILINTFRQNHGHTNHSCDWQPWPLILKGNRVPWTKTNTSYILMKTLIGLDCIYLMTTHPSGNISRPMETLRNHLEMSCKLHLHPYELGVLYLKVKDVLILIDVILIMEIPMTEESERED